MGITYRNSQPDPESSGSPKALSSRPLSERLWSVLIGVLVFITIFIAALPIFAIVRGTSAGIALARAGNASLLTWLGLELALVALGMGAFFFAYSLKYYLATATMLLLAFFGPGHRGERPDSTGDAPATWLASIGAAGSPSSIPTATAPSGCRSGMSRLSRSTSRPTTKRVSSAVCSKPAPG